MHRARVANRPRFTTSYFLATKLNKNSFCGISTHATRAAVAPRAAKRTGTVLYHIPVDSVCRERSSCGEYGGCVRLLERHPRRRDQSAALSQGRGHPLRSLEEERRPPLQVRDLEIEDGVEVLFRALFSFVFGVVRGIVQSALMLGMAPLQVFPTGKLLTNHKISVLKHLNSLPVCGSCMCGV